MSDSIDSVKLQEMFQKFGNVLSCKVVTSDDGKSRGYGFVQFELETSAKAAIEKLNGLNVGGKEMYVIPYFSPCVFCVYGIMLYNLFIPLHYDLKKKISLA